MRMPRNHRRPWPRSRLEAEPMREEARPPNSLLSIQASRRQISRHPFRAGRPATDGPLEDPGEAQVAPEPEAETSAGQQPKNPRRRRSRPRRAAPRRSRLSPGRFRHVKPFGNHRWTRCRRSESAPDKREFVFNPNSRATRFVWKIDAEGRFSEVSVNLPRRSARIPLISSASPSTISPRCSTSIRKQDRRRHWRAAIRGPARRSTGRSRERALSSLSISPALPTYTTKPRIRWFSRLRRGSPVGRAEDPLAHWLGHSARMTPHPTRSRSMNRPIRPKVNDRACELEETALLHPRAPSLRP